MKINKYVLAAMLGVGVAVVSNAQTVYMTGSTAFRGNTYTALATDGVVFHPAPTITTWGNATASSGNYMTFFGTAVGGGALTVQCSWSGSEAGVSDVALNTSEPFSADTADGAVHTNNPATTASHTVDLAMADADTPFARVYGDNLTPPAAIAHKAEVGVVTFKWVRNPGLWTGTNVSDSMIRQALTPPYGAYRATFDGVSTHLDSVYVTGRDNGSGTRVNTFGDTGFGIFSMPGQIEINSSGVMQQIGGQYIGDFGFSSGGSEAATMGANTTATTDMVNGGTGFSVIAYLGYNDAKAAVGTYGATELTYDGVLFSLQAIQEGTYTFWGATCMTATLLTYLGVEKKLSGLADNTKLRAAGRNRFDFNRYIFRNGGTIHWSWLRSLDWRGLQAAGQEPHGNIVRLTYGVFTSPGKICNFTFQRTDSASVSDNFGGG